MSDEYPTEEELHALQHFRIWNDDGEQDPAKLRAFLELAKGLWNDCGIVRIEDDRWSFITGGWSGNEDIIGAMSENAAPWIILWESTHRGGKHVFNLRDA
jgi:hypothetical protein